VLVHVRVRFDSAEFFGHIDSVLAKKLAVGQVRIGFDAHLRSLEVFVKEVKHVNVSGSKFSGVDFMLSKHSSCFVD